MKIAATTLSANLDIEAKFSLFCGDFATRIAKIAQAGFDGVELLPLDPLHVDARVVCKTLDAHHLTVAAIASGIQASVGGLTLISGDRDIEHAALKRMFDLIDLAQACRAGVVTLGSFRGRLGGPTDAGAERLCHLLGRICDYGVGRGVTIALEPVNRYEDGYLNTAGDVIRVIERVGRKNLGILLDTFHMNIEEADILEVVTRCCSHIAHVHIADSNRLSPGSGHFAFALLLTRLRECGYTGWLSAELLTLPTPDEAGAATGSALQHLLKATAGSPAP
ncbi:MAG: sugar phosphate isomerase/epimerase [Sphaerochaeta sp.]|nr:sugar phosphate isomerase/epimerase [Sphaerochaeta sp.]